MVSIADNETCKIDFITIGYRHARKYSHYSESKMIYTKGPNYNLNFVQKLAVVVSEQYDMAIGMEYNQITIKSKFFHFIDNSTFIHQKYNDPESLGDVIDFPCVFVPYNSKHISWENA